MKPNSIVALGAAFAGLSVVLGAFGAHALKVHLSDNQLDVYEVGVRYQMYHAFALMLVGCMKDYVQEKSMTMIAWIFIVGILIFSGSLYLLALTNIKVLGAITPIGGLLFITAWALLVRILIKRA